MTQLQVDLYAVKRANLADLICRLRKVAYSGPVLCDGKFCWEKKKTTVCVHFVWGKMISPRHAPDTVQGQRKTAEIKFFFCLKQTVITPSLTQKQLNKSNKQKINLKNKSAAVFRHPKSHSTITLVVFSLLFASRVVKKISLSDDPIIIVNNCLLRVNTCLLCVKTCLLCVKTCLLCVKTCLLCVKTCLLWVNTCLLWVKNAKNNPLLVYAEDDYVLMMWRQTQPTRIRFPLDSTTWANDGDDVFAVLMVWL